MSTKYAPCRELRFAEKAKTFVDRIQEIHGALDLDVTIGDGVLVVETLDAALKELEGEDG